MDAHNEHHHIPKFMLERWHCGEDRKLSQLRWIRNRVTEKRYKAKSVAKVRHLYSLNRLSAQPNQEIEPKFMTKYVDEPAAIVHKAFIANGLCDISEEQKYTWTRFLVSLVFRGPGAVDHIRECGIDAIRSQFTWGVDSKTELTEGQKELRDSYLRRDPSLHDFGTFLLPELIQTSLYNKLFFEADWGVRRIVKTDERLLIGDRPLTLLGSATTLDLVYVPLAPDVAFFVCRSVRTKQWIDSMPDAKLVRELNKGMVEQASVYVWASNFRHRRLLERRLQKIPASGCIGMGPRPT